MYVINNDCAGNCYKCNTDEDDVETFEEDEDFEDEDFEDEDFDDDEDEE